MRLLLLVFLSISNFVFSQEVASITYTGLKRSKIEALQRLTLLQPGEPLQLEVLSADLRRLSNSAGIFHASYSLDTLPNGIHIVIELREGITRYPIALLGGLEDNFWWELGYEDQNWRGKGNTVTLLTRQVDGRLGGKIAYRQNYFRHHNWGFGLQLERYASQEPLYFGDEQIDYLYDNHNLGANWRYFFNPEEDIQFGYTYFQEDYAKVNTEQTPGPEARTEQKQLIRLGYHLRKLHYDLYQTSGFDLTLSSEIVLQPEESLPFYLLRVIWRRYHPVAEKGLFATRISLGYSTNKNTPFAPFVVDSRVNIRGSGNRVDRGTAAVVFNLEYRYLLFKKPWLSLQAVAFMDIGSWRNPGGGINDILEQENLKYFMGGGLRIISPKSQQAVLRVDYGYGLHPIGTNGIVVGLGQYF
ncbi:BamA/TamA family outer membrane protein [Lewinella cohaerens]|uniref:BamA/TamA family outer membrane protein n=1 Tax=Lewinella cohaerens TaxID=70995 RepID=UPI0003739C91|nr:BamA/TamA family outer membrane protein [Lewinella cohaerens]